MSCASGFEVDFDGIDQREQPIEQGLMDGMSAIGVEGGFVGELHRTAKLVALRAGRDVDTDVSLDQARDLSLQGADVGDRACLLLGGDVGFPAEGEGMDDHRRSVANGLWV